MGGECITDADLLFGILKDEDSEAAAALRLLSVDLRQLRRRLDEIERPRFGMPGERKLPQTQQAKFVIVAAIRIAQELKHEHVETGHLLLGILDDPRSQASKCLADAGVTPEAARQAVLDVVQARPADWIARDAKNPYFTEQLHKLNWRK